MKLTHIVSADSRDGFLGPKTAIGEYGSANLCGCRSVDFFTDGIIARNRFLDSPLVTERKTVLFIDVHNEIPNEVMLRLNELKEQGEITKIVLHPHKKLMPDFNSHTYLLALEHAGDCDVVAKWDGDCIAYRNPDYDFFAKAIEELDSGWKYVCQQTPLQPEVHKMFWASTRFFLCRRETINLRELHGLIDFGARHKRWPNLNTPCLEHILGRLADEKVLYPLERPNCFLVWNWVHYFRGVIDRLNNSDYKTIQEYVRASGNLLGASDLLGISWEDFISKQ